MVDAVAAELQMMPTVKLAVLFGSRARGAAHPASDMDIGVLGVPVSELSSLAVRLSRVAGCQVDLVDLETAPPLLRFEIARDGQMLVAAQRDFWVNFKTQAMVDWWDWAPLARRIREASHARLKASLA